MMQETKGRPILLATEQMPEPAQKWTVRSRTHSSAGYITGADDGLGFCTLGVFDDLRIATVEHVLRRANRLGLTQLEFDRLRVPRAKIITPMIARFGNDHSADHPRRHRRF